MKTFGSRRNSSIAIASKVLDFLSGLPGIEAPVINWIVVDSLEDISPSPLFHLLRFNSERVRVSLEFVTRCLVRSWLYVILSRLFWAYLFPSFCLYSNETPTGEEQPRTNNVCQLASTVTSKENAEKLMIALLKASRNDI